MRPMHEHQVRVWLTEAGFFYESQIFCECAKLRKEIPIWALPSEFLKEVKDGPSFRRVN